MATYLDVPFRDKTEAKAMGARWDGALRKWFVPGGRDLEPFTRWLPPDPSIPARRELADPGKGVSLSQLLAGVASAVAQVFRQGVWTTAEIVRIDGDAHVYLELAERDADGTLVAKARAIVWARDVEQVLGTFQAATGVRLAAGVKVLVRARPEFNAQYGLTLHLDAIDPSYTLGDLEAKKGRIRDRLRADGIFDRNRELPPPFDYRALLVVSPPRAAGLGDFARDADRLQRHGLCQAVYAPSRFEGEDAPASIRAAIEAALAAWAGGALPDAIVLIRGGGAVNDLAWLNDYELARFVCLSPIPVLTGIGHERDSTVLDEVAHRRFDTPSKVIAGIESTIVRRAREAQSAFDEVAGLTLRQLRTAGGEVDRLDGDVRRQAAATLHRAQGRARIALQIVQRQARLALGDADERAGRSIADVRSGASGRLATARATASLRVAQVGADAARGLREARHRVEAAGRDITTRAATAASGQRRRAREVLAEVDAGASAALRRAADGAEAAFREVVAQGPDKTLGRGFAIVRDREGRTVGSATAAGAAGELQVQFQDASIAATVVGGENGG